MQRNLDPGITLGRLPHRGALASRISHSPLSNGVAGWVFRRQMDLEQRLRQRVAQAVESGKLPGDLLTELVVELEAAKEQSPDEGRAAAMDVIAERLDLPLEEAATLVAHLEAQPEVVRLVALKRIAEAWLEGQRRAHRDEWEKGERDV